VAASTPPSTRSSPTLPPEDRPHRLSFEAIGTGWQIDSSRDLDGLRESIAERVESFDRTWSRFRHVSLVARISREPGRFEFPAEAPDLFELYRRLYEATDGAVSPLIGRTLESLGYDSAYTLRPAASPAPVPAWDDAVAWDGHALTTVRPVLLDVGAAGKGYLVDLLCALLDAAGHDDYIVDGSGDIRRRGPDPMRVALEHPLDTSKAIGIARVSGAICSSATNRRAWGNGLHHVIDATTGLPTHRVIATWAIAATALEADGLATALFFADPVRLAERFEYDWVRMFATGRVEFSPHFDGELFS
jgi:thiamine biosynthesis lipoprotein